MSDKKPGTAGGKREQLAGDAGKIATSPVGGSAKLPGSQQQFLAVVADFEGRFRSAKNELQESALRAERRSALTRAIGSQLKIEGWHGTLTKLETDSQDKAYIAVRLAPNVELLTWNSSLVDMQGTMIATGTPLYKALMNMTEGDAIKVSGSFIADVEDGLFETSLTINGSMTAPEFLFYFNDINAQ